MHITCIGQVVPDTVKVEPQYLELDGIDETEAYFPGGVVAMLDFIKQNLVYPAEATQNKKSGRVHMIFSIGADGSLYDIKIERGISESLNAEAIRIIKLMPNWVPATFQGKPVKTKVRLPIIFS